MAEAANAWKTHAAACNGYQTCCTFDKGADLVYTKSSVHRNSFWARFYCFVVVASEKYNSKKRKNINCSEETTIKRRQYEAKHTKTHTTSASHKLHDVIATTYITTHTHDADRTYHNRSTNPIGKPLISHVRRWLVINDARRRAHTKKLSLSSHKELRIKDNVVVTPVAVHDERVRWQPR